MSATEKAAADPQEGVRHEDRKRLAGAYAAGWSDALGFADYMCLGELLDAIADVSRGLVTLAELDELGKRAAKVLERLGRRVEVPEEYGGDEFDAAIGDAQ